MSIRDTASLCRGEAYPWTLAARTVAVAAVVIASMSLVSAAGARTRGCAGAHSRITATSRAALQRTAVCLINRERRAHGLPALHESPLLNRSAEGWTNTMVSSRDFTHGADFAGRISAVGFRWSSVGENIATGFGTPAAVVRGWMASTGHCQNILDPRFRSVGTGVSRRSIAGVSSGGGTWTQDFGLGVGQSPASGDWGPAQGCPY